MTKSKVRLRPPQMDTRIDGSVVAFGHRVCLYDLHGWTYDDAPRVLVLPDTANPVGDRAYESDMELYRKVSEKKQ